MRSPPAIAVPSTPLTKRELLSLPNILARSTASLMATFGGVPDAPLNSYRAMRRIFRSTTAICATGQAGAYLWIKKSSWSRCCKHARHQVAQKLLAFGGQRRILEPVQHDLSGMVCSRIDFVKGLQGADPCLAASLNAHASPGMVPVQRRSRARLTLRCAASVARRHQCERRPRPRSCRPSLRAPE